jgi:hypothetical protein
MDPDIDTRLSVNVLINDKSVDVPLLSVQVTHETGNSSSATLKFPDGDVISGEFPLSDGNDFVPGNSIAFEAGYGSDRSVVFSGIIMKQSLWISNESGPQLIIHCYTPPPVLIQEPNVVLKLTLGNDIISINMTADIENQNSGTVTFLGNANVVPGNMIEIWGMSKRFNRNAYVRKVEHTLEAGNWITTATLGTGE